MVLVTECPSLLEYVLVGIFGIKVRVLDTNYAPNVTPE